MLASLFPSWVSLKQNPRTAVILRDFSLEEPASAKPKGSSEHRYHGWGKCESAARQILRKAQDDASLERDSSKLTHYAFFDCFNSLRFTYSTTTT